LISTIISLLMLNFFIQPTLGLMSLKKWDNLIEVLLFLIVGCTISILSTKVERARRDSEEISNKLAQERAYLETVIETVADVVTIHDSKGKITRVNRQLDFGGKQPRSISSRAEAIEYYKLRTLDGRPFQPEQMPVTKALKGETVTAVEMIREDDNGEKHYISVSAAPLVNSNDGVEGVVAVSHDITALRHYQEEVMVRAGEIEATFEALTDGILFYDQEGNPRHINSTAREMLHIQENDPRKDPLSGSLGMSDDQGKPIPLEQWPEARILRGEVLKGATAMEVITHNQGGEIAHLNISGAPVRKPNGEQIGAVCILHDVTTRRGLEQKTHKALKSLLEMAQALVMVTHDTVPLEKQQGAPEQENENETAPGVSYQIIKLAHRLAELTCQVLECKRVGIHIVEEENAMARPLATYGFSDEHQKMWNQTRKPGYSIQDELMTALRAREISVVDMTKAPYSNHPNPYGVEKMLVAPITLGDELVGMLILDHEGEVHEYSGEEMTLAGAVARLSALGIERERLLQEKAASQANEMALREANRRMDEFLGMASHELKTPLTSIKGNTQLAYRQLRSSMERMQGLFESTDRQIRRMNRLVDDLLDISRTQSDRLEIQPEYTDLARLIPDIVDEVRQAWPTREIIVKQEEQALPAYIDGDRIEQVIANYLTNALKYSYEDRPVELMLALNQEEQKIRVAVRDEGPGLSNEEQQRIWERFHRVNGIEVRSSTLDSMAGLGLGLYISKTIIEHHGGQVGVVSIPEQGSTFWFELPLSKEEVAENTSEDS
ncbi:MAG TPA: ATP-binding protein, partial [Ktedonobacteraceae bacterium]|nr:ATP-binding protein [Ktedonobacteraceae bacterium]